LLGFQEIPGFPTLLVVAKNVFSPQGSTLIPSFEGELTLKAVLERTNILIIREGYTLFIFHQLLKLVRQKRASIQASTGFPPLPAPIS
jgi:hypothetical protein